MYASVTSVPHLLALASSEEQITSRWTVVVFLKEEMKEKINHYKKYAVNIHKNSKRENVAEIDITVFQKYIIIYTPADEENHLFRHSSNLKDNTDSCFS